MCLRRQRLQRGPRPFSDLPYLQDRTVRVDRTLGEGNTQKLQISFLEVQFRGQEPGNLSSNKSSFLIQET